MKNDDAIRLLGADYNEYDVIAAERLIDSDGEPSDDQWPSWLRRVAELSAQIERGSKTSTAKKASSRENGKKGGRPKTKYQIFDGGIAVPAWTRNPNDPRAEELTARNAEEKKLGVKWYIPASKI